jgi:hypothetical protein
MEKLHDRLNALEHHVHTMQQHTQTLTRQLRWWRGLAAGLLVLAVLAWALPLGTAQEAPMAGSLAQRLTTLEQKLRYLTVVTATDQPPEIRITGANLRSVNGLGDTDCLDEQLEPIPDCPNGMGNLIVGYNESRAEFGGEDIRTGSHNVVVGRAHNFSRVGGLVVGSFNTIGGDFASVSGGTGNTVSGQNSSVSGGEGNTASGFSASVSGGLSNTVSGQNSSVSGGEGNTASGVIASVSGGAFNTASGDAASVSGGEGNTASGVAASVSGGGNFLGEVGNTASGRFASVSGGRGNTAPAATRPRSAEGRATRPVVSALPSAGGMALPLSKLAVGQGGRSAERSRAAFAPRNLLF